MEEPEYIENFPPEKISSGIKSETELIRESNIKKRDAFFASFLNDPEFAEAVEAINSLNKQSVKKKSKIKKERDEYYPGSFIKFIPCERRQSFRLRNKSPIFTKDDLIDETSFRNHSSYDLDYENLEEVVFQKRTPRTTNTRTGRTPIIPVEDVNENMINKIARKVSTKIYSDIGTSCHQCRQKTLDQKTCCRNINCVGIRGQFCGVCLQNRYGEDAAVALKDPSWHCPVCRDICNCSFCRTKAGKRPTGQLTALAHQIGYKSVKEFLDSLREQDGFIDQTKDPKCFLGYTENCKFAQMGGGKKYAVTCSYNIKSLKETCEKLEKALCLIKTYEPPAVLLGFENNFAYLSNNSCLFLGCSSCQRH